MTIPAVPILAPFWLIPTSLDVHLSMTSIQRCSMYEPACLVHDPVDATQATTGHPMTPPAESEDR